MEMDVIPSAGGTDEDFSASRSYGFAPGIRKRQSLIWGCAERWGSGGIPARI